MASLEEKVGSTPSVRVTGDDYDNAEKVGYEKKPPSTVLTNSLEDSVKLQEIQERKREHLQERLLDLKEECKIYDISFSELL